VLACVLAASAATPARAEPSWPTYHRDAGRSGLDPDVSEPTAPVQAWQSTSLGAPIWSQPLVLGSRVYVATVGDVIYALDAASGAVVWEKKLGTPVPSGELPCGDISPTVGIVGTPVIDPSAGTIYAVADTWEAAKKEAHHVLFGLSLATGAEVLRTAVDPPESNGKALLQRTALNLDNGQVVFGFGGNDGDCGEYRGTVVAAAETGGPPTFWRYQPAPPSKSGGAVWAPAGPTVDGEGNIYFATGNPNPPSGQEATTYDYSDSLIELSPALSQTGSFEPPTWQSDSNNDADLGSAGPELLPGGLLFQSGKNGIGYLLSEAGLPSSAPAVYEHPTCASFGGDAYTAGVIYIPCSSGIQALTYNESARTFTLRWKGPSDAVGPPIVSAGLVWSVATGGSKGGGTKLYGLEPSSGNARYTEALPSPVVDHFASPSAAGGRLYVSTGKTVTAYQVGTPSGAPGTETETPLSTQPQGGQTSSSAQATTQAPATTQVQATSSTAGDLARLVHAHLHSSPSGRVRLTLWCATACGGSVRLVARRRFAGLGPERPPRTITITLAHGRFGPAGGKLTVTLRLDRWARMRLRRRHRLSVGVVITSPGVGQRATAATLG
jgi:outer membrane protein assembly factor BamB